MIHLENNAKGIRRAIIEGDIDWLHVTDGYEGAGKTTFTWQLCKAVDPTFNATKNIIFTEDQFREALRHSKPGQALMLDEGALILYKRDAMTKSVKKINRLLTTIRAKNLFLAINAPDFLNTLDRYTIEHRARSVACVPMRGKVWWFSQPQISQITINPKTKKYKWPEPRFKDTFEKIDPESAQWKEYQRRKIGVVDRETDFLSIAEMATKLNISRGSIYHWIADGRLQAHKIGRAWTIPYTEYDKAANGRMEAAHNKIRVN
jgi:excisionase family DNA binding protein